MPRQTSLRQTSLRRISSCQTSLCWIWMPLLVLLVNLLPAASVGLAQFVGAQRDSEIVRRQPEPQALQAARGHLPQGGAEAYSRRVCEAVPSRVFVRHALGTECIAYLITAAALPSPRAVFYFHGDLTAREVQQPGFNAKYLARLRPTLESIAAAEQAPIVFVARPGLLGSSGNHSDRWTAKEILSMNSAVDAIKAAHGITSLVVAGQSGGSTVAAALLTLGRTDIDCAVLGSGALMLTETVAHIRGLSGEPRLPESELKRRLFDPGDRVAQIPQQPERRIFVLGDPVDTRAPFALQRQFADRLRAFGHHATVVEVAARGEGMHGVAHLALPAAARCARGLSDALIIASVAAHP